MNIQEQKAMTLTFALVSMFGQRFSEDALLEQALDMLLKEHGLLAEGIKGFKTLEETCRINPEYSKATFLEWLLSFDEKDVDDTEQACAMNYGKYLKRHNKLSGFLDSSFLSLPDRYQQPTVTEQIYRQVIELLPINELLPIKTPKRKPEKYHGLL